MRPAHQLYLSPDYSANPIVSRSAKLLSDTPESKVARRA
jgi:hypothetical protein